MSAVAGVGPVLVLVGPPGSGKSTIGRVVADRLGVDFRDTDDVVVETAGKPIADIFVDEGEAHFRTLEEEAVAAALESKTGVLALGGGAVLSEATRRRLSGHHVVFLFVDVSDAAARVGLNRDRPLLLGNVRQQLRALLADRLPLYQEVARSTVTTSGRTPEDIAAEILAGLPAATSPEPPAGS